MIRTSISRRVCSDSEKSANMNVALDGVDAHELVQGRGVGAEALCSRAGARSEADLLAQRAQRVCHVLGDKGLPRATSPCMGNE